MEEEKQGLRFTVLSDTHNQHEKLKDYLEQEIQGGDFLLYAGDFSKEGNLEETKSFLDWFSGLRKFKHKIFIAGNHDGYIADHFLDFKKLLETYAKPPKPPKKSFFKFDDEDDEDDEDEESQGKVYFLFDSSIDIDIDDEVGFIRFYGSSYVPWPKNYPYHDSFSIRRGNPELSKKWEMIPTKNGKKNEKSEKTHGIDVLITHTPPFGVLDAIKIPINENEEEEPEDCEKNEEFKVKHLGCEFLRRRLKFVRPKIHVFGHVHEGYGYQYEKSLNCHFFNAALEIEHDPFRTNKIAISEKTKNLKLPQSFIWQPSTNEIKLEIPAKNE